MALKPTNKFPNRHSDNRRAKEDSSKSKEDDDDKIKMMSVSMSAEDSEEEAEDGEGSESVEESGQVSFEDEKSESQPEEDEVSAEEKSEPQSESEISTENPNAERIRIEVNVDILKNKYKLYLKNRLERAKKTQNNELIKIATQLNATEQEEFDCLGFSNPEREFQRRIEKTPHFYESQIHNVNSPAGLRRGRPHQGVLSLLRRHQPQAESHPPPALHPPQNHPLPRRGTLQEELAAEE